MSSRFTTSCIWNITVTEEWRRILLDHRTSTWCALMMSTSRHRLLKMKADTSTTGFIRMATCRHVENELRRASLEQSLDCVALSLNCIAAQYFCSLSYTNVIMSDHVRMVRGAKVSTSTPFSFCFIQSLGVGVSDQIQQFLTRVRGAVLILITLCYVDLVTWLERVASIEKGKIITT